MALKSVRCFLIMTMILGILIGIQIKSPYQISSDGSFIMRDTITKINKERIESYALMKQKKAYEREIEKLEDKASDENEALMDYKDETVSILIITHHTNILEYIKPDKVSILSGGSIVKEGDASLAREIETSGFSAYEVSEK